MLAREECEKACLYLLSHCYETNVPALENGDKDKTYTFTPSGFKESEIFKRLIEEHFNPQPLKFEDLTPGMWVWDNFFTTFARLKNTYLYSDDALAKGTKMTTFYCDAGVLTKPFEENRYYPVQIPWEGDKKQWERTIESCKQ